MDDVSGNTVNDNSTYGKHGTRYGTTQVDGKIGKAMNFNGSSYIEIPAGNGLPIYNTSSAYSISMWIKGPAQQDKRIYAEGNTAGGDNAFTIGSDYYNSSKLRIFILPGVEITYLNSTSVVFDDNWHHIVWTDNRGNAKLYVDGNLDGTNFNYTPPVISLNRTVLGVQPYQNGIIDTTFFNGSIDDLMVFKRELSAAEVQGLYANTSSKYLFNNFTNLAAGNYSIKAYAEDTVGKC